MSDRLPHLARVVDEIAIVKSVHPDQFNHSPDQHQIEILAVWIAKRKAPCRATTLPIHKRFFVVAAGVGRTKLRLRMPVKRYRQHFPIGFFERQRHCRSDSCAVGQEVGFHGGGDKHLPGGRSFQRA